MAHDDQFAVQCLRLRHDGLDRLPGHHAALAGETGLLQHTHGVRHGAFAQVLFFAGGGVFLPFLGGVGRGFFVHGEGAVDGQQHMQFVFIGATVAAGEGEQGSGCGRGVDGDEDRGGHGNPCRS
ncbi:hypothetical protein D3C81_1878740 [compost metagenome]